MLQSLYFQISYALAQIPASASCHYFQSQRATAIGSTLVTNPVTFAPIYVIAYKVGVVYSGNSNKDSLEKVSWNYPTDQTDTFTEKITSLFTNSERKQPSGRVSNLCSGRGIHTTNVILSWWFWIKIKRKRRTSKRKIS